MRPLVVLLAAATVLGGCVGSTPSDSEQQQLANEWSPENVAREYEKQGKLKEAEEVRRNAQQQDR